MANFKSNLCTPNGYRPPIIPSQAGEVIARRGVAAVPSTLADNDMVELVPLPAGCVIVDVILDMGDLDSATALVGDVGLVNAGGTDLEANTNLITGTTKGQTGGIERMGASGSIIASDPDTTRNIGFKVTTPAGTGVGGNIGLTLFYRAADAGE
jgi:hypothetical protein